MYLSALLKYNARVAAKAQQLTRREDLYVPGLTSAGVIARPVIAFDWGESCVTRYCADVCVYIKLSWLMGSGSAFHQSDARERLLRWRRRRLENVRTKFTDEPLSLDKEIRILVV
jgi:hypothetical protein